MEGTIYERAGTTSKIFREQQHHTSTQTTSASTLPVMKDQKSHSDLAILPHEILLEILQQLPCPVSLYAAVRACKPLYAVFKAHERHVLSAVLRNAAPPKVLADAYAACKAPRIAATTSFMGARSPVRRGASTVKLAFPSNHVHSPSDNPPGSRSAMIYNEPLVAQVNQQIQEFITSYEAWRTSLPSTIDLPTLISMAKLYVLTQTFVAEYAAVASNNLNDPTIQPDLVAFCGVSASPITLSEAEQARFQRAFFKFEALRKLFGARSGSLGWERYFHDKTLSGLFLRLFEDWEVYELEWVQSYLVRRTTWMLDRIEDRFVSDVLHLDSQSSHPGNDSAALYFELDGWRMFERFQRSHEQVELINYIVSLGLPALRRLEKSGYAEKLALMNSVSLERNYPTFDDIFDSFRRLSYTSPRPRSSDTDMASDGDLVGPGIGWRWWLKDLVPMLYEDRSRMKLSGLMFWSKARLSDAGLSPVIDVAGMFLDLPDRADTPSVEERLQGIKVPWKTVYTLLPETYFFRELRYQADESEY